LADAVIEGRHLLEAEQAEAEEDAESEGEAGMVIPDDSGQPEEQLPAKSAPVEAASQDVAGKANGNR